MIVLIKSENKLKLFSTKNLNNMLKRMIYSAPDAQLIATYTGSNSDVRSINTCLSEIEDKNGWIEYNDRNMQLIENAISVNFELKAKEAKEWITKQYSLFIKKHREKTLSFLVGKYYYDGYIDSINRSCLDCIKLKYYMEFIEKTPEYKIGEILLMYSDNINKALESKRACMDLKKCKILPDTEICIYNSKDENTIKQTIGIYFPCAETLFTETRKISDIDCPTDWA